MLSHDEKYKAAIETHRHYDNLSMSVIAGMFGVAYACYSLHKDLREIMETRALFLGGAIMVLILYLIYRRLSTYATVARNVSAELERNDSPGISQGYADPTFSRRENGSSTVLARAVSIKSLVFAIAAGLSTQLIAAGLS